MDGLYFLAAIIAFVLVVFWAWANDAIPPGGRSVGLFRMRNSGEESGAPDAQKTAPSRSPPQRPRR